jgi:hypothetical protein
MSFDDQFDWAGEWAMVSLPFELGWGMFVARIPDRVFAPEIPNGSYGVFRLWRDEGRGSQAHGPGGAPRQGRRLVVLHNAIHDPLTGGNWTFREYASAHEKDPSGQWEKDRVTLEASNPDVPAITIAVGDERDVRVIAELIHVLPPQAEDRSSGGIG